MLTYCKRGSEDIGFVHAFSSPFPREYGLSTTELSSAQSVRDDINLPGSKNLQMMALLPSQTSNLVAVESLAASRAASPVPMASATKKEHG